MGRNLGSVMANVETTWGEQLDKDDMAGVPFWIHGAKLSQEFEGNNGTVRVLVLNITTGSESPQSPHGTITLGHTEERAGLLAAFEESNEPIGPCHVFAVRTKAGNPFYRMETYDPAIVQFNNDGEIDAGSATPKRRK